MKLVLHGIDNEYKPLQFIRFDFGNKLYIFNYLHLICGNHWINLTYHDSCKGKKVWD